MLNIKPNPQNCIITATMVNVLKFQTLGGYFVLFVCLVCFFTSTQQSFSYAGRFFLGLTSTKLGYLVVIRAGIHKILVRKINREDPELKKQSDLGLRCLSRPPWQTTNIQNFRTFTILFARLLCA